MGQRRRSGICCLLLGIVLTAGATSGQKPSENKIIRVGDGKIPEEYIVVFEDSVLPDEVPEAARSLGAAHRAEVRSVWKHAIRGFSAGMSDADAEKLSRHPLVKYVEENASWYVSASPQATNVNPESCVPGTQCSPVADNRLWHLDRLDQVGPIPTNDYRYCADAECVGGSCPTVYVIDGGVNKHHQEFAPSGARVTPGFNATGATEATSDRMPPDDPCMGFAEPPSDTYATIETPLYRNEVFSVGHGTAVASLIGGNRVGVAKLVTIVPIKVIRCDRFSARVRKSDHLYKVNETMLRPPSTLSAGPLYRAEVVTGKTSVADPGGWPTTTGASKQDGGVLWRVVAPSEWSPSTMQTTEMMIRGINWIVNPDGNTTGPRSNAIVNISSGRVPTVAGWSGPAPSVEASLKNIITNHDMIVIVSANNQNGNACDTTPARLSNGNPDTQHRSGVITVGGSMLINRPWSVDLSDKPGATEAKPPHPEGEYEKEPTFDPKKPVLEGRWVCGDGDSSEVCSNKNFTASGDVAQANLYHAFNGGSNAGPCVTLFAPAKNIPVASVTADNAYRDPRVKGGHASGTSWSAPIVAGVAAQLLGANPDLTPALMEQALLERTVSSLDPTTLNSFDAAGNLIANTPNRMLRLGDVTITRGPMGTASGAGTQLSVQSVGSVVSYTWYKVKADFDPNATRGAHPTLSSDQVGTGPNLSVGTLGRYWVRATGTCGAADSDIVTVTAPPVTGFSATALTGTTVRLVWNAPTPAIGGVKYHIRFRTAVNGQWTALEPVESLQLDHGGRIHGVMYEYSITARGTAGVESAPASDYVVTRTFTDDPIRRRTASDFQHTRIKGAHIAELREAVDAWRAFVGLPDAFGSYLGQTGRVYASHFTEIIVALNAARARLGLQTFNYSSGISVPVRYGRIKQQHVQDLRLALQ